MLKDEFYEHDIAVGIGLMNHGFVTLQQLRKPSTPLPLSDREPYSSDWHYELDRLTLDRARIIWTDGRFVDAFW